MAPQRLRQAEAAPSRSAVRSHRDVRPIPTRRRSRYCLADPRAGCGPLVREQTRLPPGRRTDRAPSTFTRRYIDRTVRSIYRSEEVIDTTFVFILQNTLPEDEHMIAAVSREAAETEPAKRRQILDGARRVFLELG